MRGMWESRLDGFVGINFLVCRNNMGETYCTRSPNPRITAGTLHSHKSINPVEAKLVLSLQQYMERVLGWESKHKGRGANP